MIRALFKFSKLPKDVVIIDTTSSSGEFRLLSPFILPAPPAQNFENKWQFSKVYKEHINEQGYPNEMWAEWHEWGYSEKRAYRYPMGKGAIPLYSMWEGERLGYIDARKRIYAPEYAKNVSRTSAYERLCQVYTECCEKTEDLILLDYDAYDHLTLGMSLIDVINNPNRKMGHSFVLVMMLTDILEECIH